MKEIRIQVEGDYFRYGIDDVWSAWLNILLSPVARLPTGHTITFPCPVREPQGGPTDQTPAYANADEMAGLEPQGAPTCLNCAASLRSENAALKLAGDLSVELTRLELAAKGAPDPRCPTCGSANPALCERVGHLPDPKFKGAPQNPEGE